MKNKNNETLIFKSGEDLLKFLKLQNPMFLKFYKLQYEEENPEFELLGLGKTLKIKRKIK